MEDTPTLNDTMPDNKIAEIDELTPQQHNQNFDTDAENAFAKAQVRLLHQKHLASAFFNTSVALFVFMTTVLIANIVSALMIGIVTMFYILFLFATTILTLGLVFLIDGYANLWQNISKIGDGGTYLINLMSKIYMIFPYVSIVAIAFSVASIVMYSVFKQNRSVSKIVVSSIMTALMVAVFVIVLVGGVL